MNERVIVTRHPALVEFLKHLGLADDQTKIINHANPKDIQGKDIYGVLPHKLSALCNTYTEVTINVPQELRGQELDLEQIRQYTAGEIVTYKVTAL